MTSLTPVQGFYKDRSIFITGASGFMGKVLVEKLLYSCSELKQIFILMRTKRGKTPETRLADMFKLPIFQRIRDEKPSVLKKVKVFQGDVCYDSFGLNPEQLKQIEDETSIVFHLAATLKLEGNLTDAIQMNTTGTKRALDIAKKMKNLISFIHLSTAFCNCDQEVMYEKIYEYPHKPEDLIRMAEWMDVKDLDKITPSLIHPHPNTYTYSKRLSEILVRDHYPEMPVVITRPSIVSPSAIEPVPGWVDNLNGPTGVMLGAGKGVIRTMICDGSYLTEVIPVDVAISAIITICYETTTAEKKSKQVPVYTITAPDYKKVPWQRCLDLGRELYEEYPCSAGLWYPGGAMTKNKLVHKINQILFMWLPAYIIDFFLFCFGQKRFMIFVQNKIAVGLEVLEFFTMRAWHFKADNFLGLWGRLSPRDQKEFNMDFSIMNDKEYMTVCVLGGRQYILKEPPSTIPRAKAQMKIQYAVDRICKALILGFLAYWILKKIGILDSLYEVFGAH